MTMHGAWMRPVNWTVCWEDPPIKTEIGSA
jgi:hypothetical protein